MRTEIRLLGIALLALLTCATAAAADGEIEGIDVVRAKDTRAGTLLIGEQVYHVAPETVLRVEGGSPISLADVEVPDRPQDGLVPLVSVLLGRYQAIQSGGRLLLLSVDLAEIPE